MTDESTPRPAGTPSTPPTVAASSTSSTDATQPSLVKVERAKLSATFLNNLAVTLVGSALIVPFFAALYGLSPVTADQVRYFLIGAPIWVAFGGLLHLVALWILRGLGK